MQRVEVHHIIRAPIEATWSSYTDHQSWTRWAGLGKVTLDRAGEPAPNGTGCVRVINTAGVRTIEEVVAFEPPRRMTYRLIGGIPVRDHLGEVRFDPRGDETLVTWRCQFKSKIPGMGPILELVLTRIFHRTLGRLARMLASPRGNK
ncbi:MAG: SRPBCC family protein [Deltaproteobacteria bacterium]|nr:SRPBCC family protein [Deltaproteobacteria bacterium]